MIKAFIFGKFMPFHKGHEAMIKYALSNCDFLTVLVCCSNSEVIQGNIRKKWIVKTFQNNSNIEVLTFNYDENELPNTSESSVDISKKWSEVFIKIFPDYSLLITSEPYGYYVAEFMGIEHLAFDIDKKIFPVSATIIRNDIFKYWNYLPTSVKTYFTIKVIILGTESTGKTTLTELLAKHYNCSFVKEVAREIISNSNTFKYEELYQVAEEHSKQIHRAVDGKSPLVIIDTDIHITKSYARFIFNKELEIGDEIYNINKSDLYIYLKNDVEFVQDGTRLDETERNRLDFTHRQILKEHNIHIIEIEGNWDNRFNKAVNFIDGLIQRRNTIV
jgi:HTH-type transcriptional repressor of NAD biosynthesis genes